MNIKPALTIEKFENLSPGDLFIFDWGTDSSVAIKIINPMENGRVLNLLIGPGEPKIATEQPWDVISFGAHYTVQLPVTPEEWVLNEQTAGNANMGTNGNDVYFKLQLPSSVIYVDIIKGEICRGKPSGILAYTKAWKIGRQDDDTFHTIAKGA